MEIIKQIAESSHFLHTRKRREKGVLEPLVLTLHWEDLFPLYNFVFLAQQSSTNILDSFVNLFSISHSVELVSKICLDPDF